MKIFKFCHPIACVFIFLFVLGACSSYNYKAKTVTSASAYPSTIERAKKDKRYFIMQSGINLYTVTSVDLDKAKQQMTVTLDKLDSVHLLYYKNPAITRDGTTKSEPHVRSEIHMFMKDSTSYTLDEPHTIPLNNIEHIELQGKD